jgi:hypothetical protein
LKIVVRVEVEGRVNDRHIEAWNILHNFFHVSHLIAFEIKDECVDLTCICSVDFNNGDMIFLLYLCEGDYAEQ